ncbi:MAG: hypothetical protein COV67_10830, partial [Nitrospinae bacterium CG11_big_fil_rev_8_21_14_0_20_56_8]
MDPFPSFLTGLNPLERMQRFVSKFFFVALVIFVLPASGFAETGKELFQKALQLDQDGFYEEAAQTWKKLLDSASGKRLKSTARLKLSSTYLELMEFDNAIESARAGVTEDPADFDAYFHLANAYSLTRQYPEAIAAFRKAIELRPGEGLGMVGLALCLFANKDADQAIAELRTAKELFKEKKNIPWHRDTRIMINQIQSFQKYPADFADLWLENNLKVVRKTYEKAL